MKYDPEKHHRRSIRLKGYDYSQSGAYFITICSWQKECLFGKVVNGQMELSRYGEIVQFNWENLPQRYLGLELDAFVVMPNHVHGIVVLRDGGWAGLGNQLVKCGTACETRPYGLGEIVRGFKTFSARRINHVRKMAGVPVWHRNYWEHIIRNDVALENIRAYIHNNPRAWSIDELHP